MLKTIAIRKRDPLYDREYEVSVNLAGLDADRLRELREALSGAPEVTSRVDNDGYLEVW